MEFKRAMRTWRRMCESNDQCEHCPIPACDETFCRAWVMSNADCANDIIVRWADEHPERTIADDFFDKHPKAVKNEYGTPEVCAQSCGYVTECPRGARCSECWRRSLEEVEG